MALEQDERISQLGMTYSHLSLSYLSAIAREQESGEYRGLGPIEARARSDNERYATIFGYCKGYIASISRVIFREGVKNAKQMIAEVRRTYRDRLQRAVDEWQYFSSNPAKFKLETIKREFSTIKIINKMYDVLTQDEDTTYGFETDKNKAIIVPFPILTIDSVSLTHISNYFYKCVNNHCFNMDTILDYCRHGAINTESDNTVRTCSVCPECKRKMDKRLYKQAKIIENIHGELLDNMLEKAPNIDGATKINTDYDPERINLVAELMDCVARFDKKSLRSEVGYYRESLGQIV